MTRIAQFLLALSFVLTLFVPARADQSPQTFEKQITIKLNYLLHLPDDYGKDANKKHPVILFLHGAGERGTDVNKVKIHGPPKLLAAGTELPVKQFVVISPQCPPDQWWQPHELIALLDDVLEKHPNHDPARIYLTGLSMGGYGTWDLATRYPNRFAAIAPICGGGDARRAARALRNMPTWVFHGEKDNVVPISQSEEMVEALKKAGNDVKFTRYPEANHDSWTETYNNPELYSWLLQHKRREPARAPAATPVTR
jgi:predicted peptidase